jgi:radical SAM protein with 4Fe4S-binding SPASM domain
MLDSLEESGLKFSMGTNAVLIDDNRAKRLSSYKNLIYVQASLDGITPEVHSVTRGNTHDAAMNGIRNLIRYKVPFALAPTLHEGNLHEIHEIGRFAYSNGGFLAPNHLRKFPHAPHTTDIHLENESLRKTILDTFSRITAEFGPVGKPAGLSNQNFEDLHGKRCKHVCGNAWYNVDIDCNGDVYPCHLLREKEFIFGNILREGFAEILERGRNGNTRVKAFEIPKCRECAFVATCGGGCRASAFYNKGTFAGEDEFCDILYKFEVDKLFLNKSISFHL